MTQVSNSYLFFSCLVSCQTAVATSLKFNLFNYLFVKAVILAPFIDHLRVFLAAFPRGPRVMTVSTSVCSANFLISAILGMVVSRV